MSYCKTCQKGVDRSATGKPTYGTIDDRLAVGVVDYVDPKGKRAVPYANVMEKLGVTREAVEAEVKEFAELVGTDQIPDDTGRSVRPSVDALRRRSLILMRRRSRRSVDALRRRLSLEMTAICCRPFRPLDSSDSDSVASSTSSRGRPRLSEEEKQRRANEKAEKKRQKEEAKAQKAKEKADAKAQKDAQKRKSLIDEITALNSEVSTAMDISTMPEEIADLKSMLSDLKKQKKENEKQALKDQKQVAKDQAKADADKKKADAKKALKDKRDALISEINTAQLRQTRLSPNSPRRLVSFARCLAI